MTQNEYLAALPGQHVPLTCENHSHLRWSCKKMATSRDSQGQLRYNGLRSLFFDHGKSPECNCGLSKLFVVLEGTKNDHV